MKNSFPFYLIGLSILLCNYACTNPSQNKQDSDTIKTKGPEKKTIDEIGGFRTGTWRIDSVAENNVIIDRLIDDTLFPVMNFHKTGAFYTLEATSQWAKATPAGTWKIENDSLFILTEKGNVAMRYGFEIKESLLILKGNFNISNNIKKKPTFYLSKYK